MATDEQRLRALELALQGVIAFVPRGVLVRAEENMAALEAAAVGDERVAATMAGALFSQALVWHLEGDDEAGLVGPDTQPDPEELAAFEFEVDRLVRVEGADDPDADDLDRIANAILAEPSKIVTMGNMMMRSRLAGELKKRARQARQG